jgi:6-phosphogluconolactonase
MSEREVIILADAAALAAEAAQRFVAAAAAAVAERGRFSVALAGGSTPAAMYRLLGQQPLRDQVAWDRVRVLFGDERCVPPDAPESNFRMAQETLLAAVPVPPAGVLRMAGELPGPDAADRYAEQLAKAVPPDRPGGWPRVDLVLLGMGDDGHTASLFPGMPVLDEDRRCVAWTEVPDYVRPAVTRLTLTLPVLNAARQVLFLIAGRSKAPAVEKILASSVPSVGALPAGRVRPAAGALTWLLDRAAATP